MIKSYRNFILLIISLGCSLGVSELYLRWNPPSGVYMATRNVVQQTHSEPSADPILGYVPRAGLEKPFRNREFNVMVKINSMNMRGREYSIEKPGGFKRIAAAGDSFVFGWGVENQEVFTEILEKEFLKNTEVLNFGVSGYLPFQELERLKKDALRFQPDLVLFFMYGIPDGAPANHVLISADPDSIYKKTIRFLREHSYLFVLIQRARGSIQVSRDFSEPESDDKDFDGEKRWQVLTDLRELSLSKHFPACVVYVPLKEYARKGMDPDSNEVKERCLKEGIPFFDLTDALHRFWTAEGRSPYFRIDDHWNRDGHRVAAAAISAYLKQSGVLSYPSPASAKS